jgi:glycosyltransferase involved in cell wall biosynthesis
LASTLRIGLDAHMVGGQETGNETYVRGLVDGLAGLEEDFDLSVYHLGAAWRAGGPQVHFRRLTTASSLLRLAADLPLRAARERLDVLHTTYAAPLLAPCPVVVTVHDISFVAHPEWFSDRDLRVLSLTVPWSMRRAARIVTVSELCRAEIIAHYRLPEDRVVAIPNAAGPAAQPLGKAEAGEELAQLGLDPNRPYLLAVGNLQPRKNLARLIEAFRRLPAGGLEVDLVIVGPRHFQGEQVLAAGREAGDRVHFTGYLDDRQLAACYRRAEAFVFPSIFEGFGIPALEAMAHGIPVASSRGGALPEVCGAAALYFDPLDVDSIEEAVRRVLTDDELRASLVHAGHERERGFSWHRSAEQTLGVYRAVAGSRDAAASSR